MSSIVFPAPLFDDLKKVIGSIEEETCALLILSRPAKGSTRNRYLVREIHLAPEGSYRRRSSVSAQLDPDFLIPYVKRARDQHLSLAFVHTHPHDSGSPSFSSIDDDGEKELRAFLDRRTPGISHVAMVVGPHGVSARILGTSEPLDVVQVGARIQNFSDGNRAVGPTERWDRQVRAIGRRGQASIQSMKVAIVGLGGTGSVVCQQLTYLGVNQFLLVDFDSVDPTSLNRLVGAVAHDVNMRKTAVARRNIHGILPQASVEEIAADVTTEEAARRLLDADIIFSCTDSHASRALINQLSYQYLIPAFDLGVAINANEGTISHVVGRTQMLAPGLGCLVCAGVIDGASVRRDFMTAAERRADPYVVGHQEPEPAVISLNSTMASLAVTMFLGAATDLPLHARLQYLDAIKGQVRSAQKAADPACVVCSRSGALALADEWPLPLRPKQT